MTPPESPRPPRSLRADAARNRELLLAAATAEFAERGIDASVADIARRAGVGKGTVFNHFPTKDHLLTAIVVARLARLTESAEEFLTGSDAGAALLDFLTLGAEQQQQLDLAAVFARGTADIQDPAEVDQARERMVRAVDALVARAREQGSVRPDVTGADVVLLMCAPSYAAGPLSRTYPDLWRRYLMVLFDGLRPEGAHTLPHPPPPLQL
ncbi:TetR/AcrR family transcriptional regulator [Actinacidiphila bryophytorum]|uniref:TetR/AcrR family transcriptional regulator n=1 Tax=Actinacidiphila bryophytorum TaxID=1436133 RepID=UPI002176E3A3|nr:TetR/AcrR family transcriptional regulator [Actinacidiphila bryophytorum]UWE07554.1 TetR/AcrR family transcriptional regulator [Actinacidiphila bryophytorum]